MQKILIPTDFSTVADNALNYAIEIAAQFKSELVLYHVYSINKKLDYNWEFSKHDQPFVKEIEQKMRSTKLRFKDKLAEKGISIQTRIEEDHIFSLFDRLVQKHDIDMIVMGSKGASGIEKVVFGSVAETALELAKVPVLIVPPSQTEHSLEHIVLAVDLEQTSTATLNPLQEIAEKFKAKVTLLNINTGDTEKGTSDGVGVLLKNLETHYQEVPMTESINESINQFISYNSCDLLCMIRREKGFFESLFETSVTKTQAFNTRIPLLVLPEK